MWHYGSLASSQYNKVNTNIITPYSTYSDVIHHLQLNDVPGVSHPLIAGMVVVPHAGLHVGVEQPGHLGLELVGRDTCTDLHEEDDPEEDGEGEGHAVVLLDGSAAPEESNKEDDAADDDEEHRSGEELVSQEVEVLAVSSLDHAASHYEEQP